MSAPRVAIVQFPGVNCEAETRLALRRVGLDSEIVTWTREPSVLHDFDAYVLPGGFAYQDRVRAGALAAKHPMMDVLIEEADRGKPVLGICNGAQVLVEAGMVPGGHAVELALARNRVKGRTGYYAAWVYTRVTESRCVFTRGLEPGTVLPLPVAHGEGRFVSGKKGYVATLKKSGRTPLVYATPSGAVARRFPDNPNGAEGAVAAVCNERGNVLAMMPHPERAQYLEGMPVGITGEWGRRRDEHILQGAVDGASRQGPGLLLFEGLRRHLMEGA